MKRFRTNEPVFVFRKLENLELYLSGKDVYPVSGLIDDLDDDEVGASLELAERNGNMRLIFDELEDLGILEYLVRILVEKGDFYLSQSG